MIGFVGWLNNDYDWLFCLGLNLRIVFISLCNFVFIVKNVILVYWKLKKDFNVNN